MMRAAILASVVIAALATGARAEVERVEILAREPFADGAVFGLAGAYEMIRGRLHYAVDPTLPENAIIVDLDRAPRDPRGRVGFSGDFTILRPAEAGQDRRIMVVEAPDHGLAVALQVFNNARGDNPNAPGSGFLFRQGITLVAVGWDWTARGPGRLGFQAPIAVSGEGPLTGTIAREFRVDRPTQVVALADPGVETYLPRDANEATAQLTVRASTEAPRVTIPRTRWRFARVEGGAPVTDAAAVLLTDGFQPGRLYEVTYTARDPRVGGLGLLALRDAAAFFRHDDFSPLATPNPLAMRRPTRVIAFGHEQGARALRAMLGLGLHIDERERPILEGIFLLGGGAGFGGFNYRFALLDRRARQGLDQALPTARFPFASTPLYDPISGRDGDWLARPRGRGSVPRVVQIQGAHEYWDGAAALAHVDPAGRADVAIDPMVRIYAVAGAAPRIASTTSALLCASPLDWRPIARAGLVALDDWIAGRAPPPDSVYPRLADGTLVDVAAYASAFPGFAVLQPPPAAFQPALLDLGVQFALAGIAQMPATMGPRYAGLVPAPDADGNDRGMILLPEIGAPLGTYLGWNQRGASDANLLADEGAFVSFAVTPAARAASGDRRRALAERYANRVAYREAFERAALALVLRRLYLPADIVPARERALRLYDRLTTGRAATCRDLME